MIGGANRLASGYLTRLIFLQRNLPPLDQIDLVTFSNNPQVHAFDNISIVETLEAQPQAVATAQIRAKGLPVMVSPVTLKMRFNPYATGQMLNSRQSELPPAERSCWILLTHSRSSCSLTH